MSIIRAPRPESNFYLLNKAISEDGRLSWAARGLLVYLLGKPDHWKVSVAHLRKETEQSAKPTGRDGIYAMLEELIAAGYVQREQGRNDGGRLGEVNYLVSEVPASPLPAQPDTAPPDTAAPLPANPTLVSIEDKQGLTGENKNLSGGEKLDAFELAWKAYPKREGANPKNKAQSAWNARLQEGVEPERMLAGVARYAAYCRQKGNVGTEYVMQAVRFFGKEKAFDNDWKATGGRAHGIAQNFNDKTYGGTPDEQFADFLLS